MKKFSKAIKNGAWYKNFVVLALRVINCNFYLYIPIQVIFTKITVYIMWNPANMTQFLGHGAWNLWFGHINGIDNKLFWSLIFDCKHTILQFLTSMCKDMTLWIVWMLFFYIVTDLWLTFSKKTFDKYSWTSIKQPPLGCQQKRLAAQ